MALYEVQTGNTAEPEDVNQIVRAINGDDTLELGGLVQVAGDLEFTKNGSGTHFTLSLEQYSGTLASGTNTINLTPSGRWPKFVFGAWRNASNEYVPITHGPASGSSAYFAEAREGVIKIQATTTANGRFYHIWVLV